MTRMSLADFRGLSSADAMDAALGWHEAELPYREGDLGASRRIVVQAGSGGAGTGGTPTGRLVSRSELPPIVERHAH